MEAIIYLLIFIISAAVLVKSADSLVESAEKIGLKLKLPYFFIGSILIGFGTSLPELATSIFGALEGFYEIPVSNVIGSNITNILLIIGLPAFLFTIKIKKNIIKSEIPFLILSSLLPVLFFSNSRLTLVEGLIFLIAFISYMIYIYKEDKEEVKEKQIKCNCIKEILIFITALVLLSISSKYAVDSLINLAKSLSLKVETLSAILLALSTSLPELITSFTILLKNKNQDMIIGNVIGSNVINVFLILGVVSLLAKNIQISQLLFNLSVFLLFITFLFVFVVLDKKIEKEEGFIFLVLYLFYIIYLLFPNLL
jgi:cation:H+ antiporter